MASISQDPQIIATKALIAKNLKGGEPKITPEMHAETSIAILDCMDTRFLTSGRQGITVAAVPDESFSIGLNPWVKTSNYLVVFSIFTASRDDLAPRRYWTIGSKSTSNFIIQYRIPKSQEWSGSSTTFVFEYILFSLD